LRGVRRSEGPAGPAEEGMMAFSLHEPWPKVSGRAGQPWGGCGGPVLDGDSYMQ
jgi:hypothetical protein